MADNFPPGESISEAFPGGFAVVRLRTQTLIILHLQPDDPDHKSGCSADDPASDRFVKKNTPQRMANTAIMLWITGTI